MGLRLTVSLTQWRRWLAGNEALPRPANARVLERMFGRPVQELFASPASLVALDPLPADRAEAPEVLEDLVMDAANDSARFLSRVERTNLGPNTLEQFESDIRRLATKYPHRAVFPSFTEITELRDRAFDLLEGRQPPRQTRELYLVAGQLCAMLAMASLDLGWSTAAETQARTAWLCADLAGHNALRAWVRGMQARVAYWDDRPADAAHLAADGFRYTPERGTAHVQLAVVQARALGRLRDSTGVDAAIGRAVEARDAVTAPDDPGGLFSFPLPRQIYYGATARVWLGDDYQQAAADAQAAITLYLNDPPPERRLGELCLARLDLAAALLGRNDLEGASEQLLEVMAISSRRRTSVINRRLRQLSSALEQPRFATTTLGSDTREQISHYSAVSLVPALPQESTT
jgi:hypothetical protein